MTAKRDIPLLADTLKILLAPALPYLTSLANKAAEEGTKKLGADAWAKAKAVWAKLHPRVEAKPAVLDTAREVAASPEDEEARSAFRYQLRKLLEAEPDLAREVEQLVGGAGALQSYQAHVEGSGAVAQGPGAAAASAGGVAVAGHVVIIKGAEAGKRVKSARATPKADVRRTMNLEVAAALDTHIAELDKIIQDAADQGGESAEDRLIEWKERAMDYLDANISRGAALELHKVRCNRGKQGQPAELRATAYKNHRTLLVRWRDRVRRGDLRVNAEPERHREVLPTTRFTYRETP